MSLIKKIDVPKYFAARRALRLAAVRGSSPPRVGASATDPACSSGNAKKSIQPSSPGHSSGAIVAPKA